MLIIIKYIFDGFFLLNTCMQLVSLELCPVNKQNEMSVNQKVKLLNNKNAIFLNKKIEYDHQGAKHDK